MARFTYSSFALVLAAFLGLLDSSDGFAPAPLPFGPTVRSTGDEAVVRHGAMELSMAKKKKKGSNGSGGGGDGVSASASATVAETPSPGTDDDDAVVAPPDAPAPVETAKEEPEVVAKEEAEPSKEEAAPPASAPQKNAGVNLKRQPLSPSDEAKAAARYGAIQDVGERAFAILVDLGLVELHE
jgi:hypothetical protein